MPSGSAIQTWRGVSARCAQAVLVGVGDRFGDPADDLQADGQVGVGVGVDPVVQADRVGVVG